MADVVRCSVRSATEGNGLPRRDHARRGAIGARERTEVVFEGSVLLDDEDDVLDLGHPRGPVKPLGCCRIVRSTESEISVKQGDARRNSADRKEETENRPAWDSAHADHCVPPRPTE